MKEPKTLGERLCYARTRAGMTQRQLAKLIGVRQPSISQIENGSTKETVNAAAIAAILNVRALWLEKGIGAMDFDESRTSESDDLYIPQYDISGSMGNGRIIGQTGVVRALSVNTDWIRENLGGRKNIEGICVVTGYGDSMEPLFRSGDPLIVDTHIKEFVGDFPYFFRVGNEAYIKRLQRVPGEGFRAISENKKYETWTVRPDMDFEILGRVIKVWFSTDF